MVLTVHARGVAQGLEVSQLKEKAVGMWIVLQAYKPAIDYGCAQNKRASNNQSMTNCALKSRRELPLLF